MSRGLSETLGFTIIFSLIVVSVATVTVTGIATLEDAQNAEQLTNTERAFDVLAHNQEDMFLRGAPSRATEIKLSGGRLGLASTTTVTVDVDGGPTYESESRPIVYAFDDTEIVYENGAIIRTDADSAIVSRPPPGEYENDTAILHLVNTTQQDGTTNIGGEGTRLVRTVRENTTVLENGDPNPTGPDFDLTIETTDVRAQAWERYLDEQFDVTCTRSSGTVQCTGVEKDHLLLLEHEIPVGFE